MTAVRTPPNGRRHVPSWLGWLLSSSPSRAERLYVVLTVGLCIGLLASYAVGRLLGGAQQQQHNRALVAGGRDSRSAQLQPVGTPRPTGAQAPVAQDTAPATLPAWVQAFRGAKLWSAASGGVPSGVLAQWQYLSVVRADAKRLDVRTSPSDGDVTEGWVDIDDVGVSGPPPDWLVATRDAPLFTSADGTDPVATVSSGTAVVVSGESTADRVNVYWPIDVTSRRSGYGWVQSDAVAPTTAPAGLAFPSWQYRAVPKSGPGVYRVALGDSIQSLAARFGVSRDDLFRLSGLDPSSHLVVGEVLQVPATTAAAAPAPAGPRKVRDISPGVISAEHAVVIDADSGQVLWERDANAPVAPASLTKIVTALVTLDHANLSDHVTVNVDSRRMTDSTVMGLYPGEDVTIEDLLYGLMLPSGNDAALALSEYVAGTWESFADLMNEKVRSLGLTGSHFVNPHGLDADGHYSSAYDMAMLARAGMRDPTFRALASAKMYETPDGKGYTLYNLNRLLWSYPGSDGVKIGYTDAAGKAIVGSAMHDGHRVIVAAMRSGDMFSDATALLDWAFGSYSWDPEQ